jgi:argininosuccinate synthase
MELLGNALEYIYQATMDEDCRKLFATLSALIAKQVYYGKYFDPSTSAAFQAINDMAKFATGTIELELYKGNIYFKKLTNMPHSLYRAADASMEKSSGLNPISAQGYLDIENVKAVNLVQSGQTTLKI